MHRAHAKHLPSLSLCPSFAGRFALLHPEQQLGLPIGQHITLKAPQSGKGPPTMRPYTPTSDDDQRGYVDFVIKVCLFGPYPLTRSDDDGALLHPSGPHVFKRHKGSAFSWTPCLTELFDTSLDC